MKSVSEVDAKVAMLNPVKIGVGAPVLIAAPVLGKLGWDAYDEGNVAGGVAAMLIALGLAGGGIFCLATAAECPES